MPFKRALFTPFFLVIAGLLLTGCPRSKGPSPEEQAPEAAAPEAAKPAEAASAAPAPLTIGTEWTSLPSLLETVYFGFMAAELSDAARTSLKKNAATIKAILKNAPGVKIQAEGHCDERGTLEYNLALGQRRANALRNYYASLGLPKAAMSTVSYGEERPVCTQADEECWGQNRRGETVLSSPAGAVSVPAGK